MPVHDPQRTPIAVVGVSAIFPGSVDATGFWHDILEGKDLVRDVPETHWLKEDYFDPDPSAPDKTYAVRGAFLDSVPFDPLEWGVPPSIVPATDTTQLLALVVAKQVLEDATRGRWPNVDRERISCILGVTSAQELLGTMVNRLQHPVWAASLRELGYAEDEVREIVERIGSKYVPWQESTFPGLLGNVVAGRIANRLDIGGTNCVTDAACASSFSAISMAVNELWLGQSDLVISGGADTMNDIFMYMCFSKTPALSKSGDCRPFSDKADGTLLGEGLGMVALKRLPDAERDGDRVYALLKGIGSSSDGRAKSVYAPVPTGQAKALHRAYAQAGYGPETVELVEAHGTGTKAGDAAEFEGLQLAFDGSGRKDRQWCALGTVKSQIGHTKAAAGAAGLFKVVMALHHKVLPPTIKIDQPNPKLNIEKSPFYLNTKARPWIRKGDHPRRGAVSSFGFGGSNFHLVLEEYRGPADAAPRLRTAPTELVVLSAATPEALAAEARKWAARSTLPGFLRHAARATQLALDPTLPARLAVVAVDEAELASKLGQLADRLARHPDETFAVPTGSYSATGAEPGKVAFLFPGQGSQYVGMGADLAIEDDAARGPWDRAADLGLELHEHAFPRPTFGDPSGPLTSGEKKLEDALRATEIAQPAIGLASLSQLALLARLGLHPDAVGGHSYGEITALHAAGVLSEADTVRVARRRGELMAAAASTTEGAMTAVAKPIDVVRAHVEAVPGCVVANHNAPDQVVVSGSRTAIEALERRLAGAKIEAKRLPVATAFHSPVVADSVGPFRAFLADVRFEAPRLPVWHNPEAAPHGSDPAAIREGLATAIARPVRFVEQVESMYAAGVRTFVEVGPGHVLTNLVGEILGDRPHVAVNVDRKKKHGVTALQNALGRLVVAGVKVDFAPLWAPYAPFDDPHARPPSKVAIRIDGSNVGKPYPPKGGAKALPKPNLQRTGFAKSKEPPPAPPQVVERVVEKVVHVPVAAPAAAAPGAPSMSQQPQPPADPWILAFQEAQRATVEAHTAYQRAMAESHEQFLRTLETSFHGLARMMGADLPAPPSVALPAPSVALPVAAIAVDRRVPAPLAPPMPAQAQVWTPAPPPVQSGLDLLPRPKAALPSPPPSPSSAPPADLERLLLDVVAEKTGYPAEMLGMHMALESDLGVDSIKRVEILSAVRERAPGLPEVDAAEMAKLQTLGQVVEHLRASSPSLPTPTRTPTPRFESADLEHILLAVVAEKTGYPAEMLGMHMALESDLGVDSIKRVEILSAVRERAPGLPEVDAAEMAKLQTLGQVVEHLRASSPSLPTPTPKFESADLERILLAVVADKTGYPAEMLGMHMALESDLGVDSIKRVEILSAVRERAPGLPEVDAAEMAKLQTLGQVVEHLQASLSGSGSGSESGSGLDLERLLLEVVADKTGYPAEMLGMHMALESDLGVDSIKRVEILSAMRERAPGLPEVDAAEMAKLQTLGQVVEKLRGSVSGSASAPGSTSEPAVAEGGLGRWVLDVVDAPALGLSHPGLSPDAKIAVCPTSPVAEALREALAGEGLDAFVADVPADASAVVLVHGLLDEAPTLPRRAFLAANAAARRLATGGLFVTLQDTGGDFGLSGSTRGWLGGFAGLAKTAAQEWKAACKAIDVARAGRSDAEVARLVVQELLAGGPEPEVGLLPDGRRVTLASVATPAAPTASPVERDTVVVATGGARGVTARCLVELARARGGRYALLGRTALAEEPASTRGLGDEASLKKALMQDALAKGEKPAPAEVGRRVASVLANREVRATLDALAAAGAQATYVACDVNDAASLRAALDGVRAKWGPIGAVVHAAGVLADKLLADKTPDQFDRVHDTKVEGFRALLAATAGDPLRAIVAFSSVAGRCGNRGQADYSMANEALAKVCDRLAVERPDCVVKALQWGPWEGGMVTAALKAAFAAQGVAVIPLDAGARMFVDELADRSGRVEVVLGGEPRMAPLIEAQGERVVTLRVRADARTHPWLADHAVAGAPVIPVVLALEWMARAASACRPDLQLVAIRDVKVLRGIRLESFSSGGDWFDVSARQVANGAGSELAVEVRRVGGPVHYTAAADLGARAPAPAAPSVQGLGPFAGPVYDGRILFHGGRFQVIRSVDGISDAGVTATLSGTADMGWADGPWRTDPAALDGGLQLALLWSARVLGGASLPMGVSAFRTFRDGAPAGSVRAVLTGQKRGRDKTLTDIVFVDDGGRVVHELRGVESILRPS